MLVDILETQDIEQHITISRERRGESVVNTDLLEDAIKRSGKRKQYLADKIGCTIQSFRMRCTNRYDFKSTDIDILCAELGITKLTEKERIFFAKNVDNPPTDGAGA